MEYNFENLLIMIKCYPMLMSEFCCLLIIFANSLDSDQNGLFNTHILFLEECFEKVNFEKSRQTTREACQKNYPACKELRNGILS